jgi:adenine phosphoribosyltransferase
MSQTLEEEVKSVIRNIPDFPKVGIQFKDISTLMKEPKIFDKALEAILAEFPSDSFDLIAGIESRGFLVGAPLSIKSGKGFVMIRKPNKLPGEKIGVEYGLEYGKDRIEVHTDAVKSGQRVLIVDDLIATGGSCAATASLIKQLGGEVVGVAFLIELVGLGGRTRLEQVSKKVYSVVSYQEI